MDERQLAVDLYNGLWPLLEKPDRTSDEDARLARQGWIFLIRDRSANRRRVCVPITD